MPRFSYSLQSVLDIKMKLENQAKLEFSGAVNELNTENEKLEALYARKSQYENEHEKLLNGKLNILEIEAAKNAVFIMDEYIVLQKENIKKAEKKVDLAREKLRELMTDRKAHEALREKAFQEFIAEENRSESKEVDELTSYTYGQKRQVKE